MSRQNLLKEGLFYLGIGVVILIIHITAYSPAMEKRRAELNQQSPATHSGFYRR